MPRLLLLLLFLLGSASGATPGKVDPALLRTWARGAVNIMETYEDYKDAFDLYRPKVYDSAADGLADRKRAFFLMVEFDIQAPGIGNGSSLNGVTVDTEDGPLNGSLQMTRGSYHASWQGADHGFGAYFIIDMMGLAFSGPENPGRDSLFTGLSDNEAMGTDAGFLIAAAYYRLRDMEINAGSLIRFVPLTAKDATGREVFRFEKDLGYYTGNQQLNGLFLDLRKGPYSLNTLFSAKENLEFLGFGMGDFQGSGFEVRPYFRYAKFRTRFQAGAEADRRLSDHLTLEMEAMADMHRNSAGRFEAFHHAMLGHTWTLFGLPRIRLSEFRRYDFRVLLDGDLSHSTDAVDESAWGVYGGLTFKDMLGLLSLRLGAGYNDYRHLRLFPVKDILTMDFMARLAW